MKLFLLCLGVLLFTRCSAPLTHSKETLRAIPIGSSKIIADSPRSAEEVYSSLAKSFAREGCPVRSEKESMQIICDGKSLEGGTTIKALAFVEQTETGSRTTMSGEWGLSSDGQLMMSAFGAHGVSAAEKLKWNGIQPTKPCVAFQYMVTLANTVPEAKISYKK